jgi:hypothetical protein
MTCGKTREFASLLLLATVLQALGQVVLSSGAHAVDPEHMQHIVAECQSGPTLSIQNNDEPDLCKALHEQAISAADTGSTFCVLPVADPELGISRPNWSPVDPSAIESLLQQYLPLFGWNTREVQNLLKKDMPQATSQELIDEHWRRYGDAMLNVLRSNADLLQTALIDVDNDGTMERVYRTAVLQPIDRTRPDLGWRVLPCNLPSGASASSDAVIPYRAVFFEQSEQAKMGEMALFDKIENHDVFLFNGRSYLTLMGPSSTTADRIQVQKLPNTPQRALFFQVCGIGR